MPVVNTAYTASVSIIVPYVYTDPTFLGLMKHYCTIVLASEATVASSTYGHQRKDYETAPRATYNDVRCRLRSLTADETMSTGREGEVVEDMYLYIPRRWMPQTMREHASATRHQVINVKTLRGEMVHPGVFDVKSVREVAGEQHHYLCLLRKAG